jgi:hypothetical protein
MVREAAMFYSEFDLTQVYKIGPSNSTTAVSQFRLGEDNTFIAIESVAMLGGELFLRAAPSRMRPQEKAQAQPDVIASLDRSLEKHADVWAELSKY